MKFRMFILQADWLTSWEEGRHILQLRAGISDMSDNVEKRHPLTYRLGRCRLRRRKETRGSWIASEANESLPAVALVVVGR